jgi:hypothetical protein
MPWTMTYSASGVEVRFSGRCSAIEVLGAHEDAFNHRYEAGLQYLMVDFAHVEYLDVALADLLRLADYDRQYLLRNPPFALAIVAPQAPVLALVRTYERYMVGTSLRSAVVSTRDEAHAWLRMEMLEIA